MFERLHRQSEIEALRRIRKAEETGAVELDLSGWKEGKSTGLKTLNRLPRELGRLTSLHSLDLSGCGYLSDDLSSLASLTSLKSLKLERCRQLSADLAPLAGLTSLQTLDLSGCGQLRDLSKLKATHQHVAAGRAFSGAVNSTTCPD